MPTQTSPGRPISTGRSLSRRSAEFQLRLRDHTQTSLWAGRKVRQTLVGGGGVGWGGEGVEIGHTQTQRGNVSVGGGGGVGMACWGTAVGLQ